MKTVLESLKNKCLKKERGGECHDKQRSNYMSTMLESVISPKGGGKCRNK